MSLPDLDARAEIVVDLDAIAANVATLKARAGGGDDDGRQGRRLRPRAGRGRRGPRGPAAPTGSAPRSLEEALALRAGRRHRPDPDLAGRAGRGLRRRDRGGRRRHGVHRRPGRARSRPRPGCSACAARVQLKVDTGLSRGGATERDVAGARRGRGRRRAGRGRAGDRHLVALRLQRRARPPGQRRAGEGVRAGAQGRRRASAIEPEVRHLSNSAGALLRPWSAYDLVRCGIASYGLSPAPDVVDRRGARPGAGDDRARPARAGQAGARRRGRLLRPHLDRRARHDRRPGPGRVRRRGAAARVVDGAGPRRRRARQIAGRVCMDQLVVDLGDDAAQAGDEVVLFGTGARRRPHRAGLGRGMRHDLLRDRHQDRRPVRAPARLDEGTGGRREQAWIGSDRPPARPRPRPP